MGIHERSTKNPCKQPFKVSYMKCHIYKKNQDSSSNKQEWIHTQLCMAFPTMTAQVGILESRRLKGGITPVGFRLFSLVDVCCLCIMYSSSNFVIWGCRSGVLDVAESQTSIHRKPDNPKITKGPYIPPWDMRIGDSMSPTTFPSWNPAIAIPTALERSVGGNHLQKKKTVLSLWTNRLQNHVCITFETKK